MTGRLFDDEHNLRVRNLETIFELDSDFDAGRSDPETETGRWRETFHCVIMEQFCPRAIFPAQFGIPTQRKKHPRCLPASTVIEWIG